MWKFWEYHINWESISCSADWSFKLKESCVSQFRSLQIGLVKDVQMWKMKEDNFRYEFEQPNVVIVCIHDMERKPRGSI